MSVEWHDLYSHDRTWTSVSNYNVSLCPLVDTIALSFLDPVDLYLTYLLSGLHSLRLTSAHHILHTFNYPASLSYYSIYTTPTDPHLHHILDKTSTFLPSRGISTLHVPLLNNAFNSKVTKWRVKHLT
jgi:hypothetical protein